MSIEEIHNHIRDIVAEVYDVPPESLRPETHFIYDLDDSLELVEVLIDCERVFGLKIPDREAEQCETFGKLVQYIQRRVGKE